MRFLHWGRDNPGGHVRVYTNSRVQPETYETITALSREYSVPLGMGRTLTSAPQSTKERGLLSALIA